MSEYFMKRGDLLPELTAQFLDGNGNAIDLTGASVKFIMADKLGSAPKISAAATIVDAATGQVKYTWAGTDTNTAGEYNGEFQATLSGKKLTAPNDTYIQIKIMEDLGD